MGALGYLAASVPPRMASAGAAVALPILAVQQLGDVAVGGLFVAASLGPSVLAAPLVGTALDRAAKPGLLVAGSGLLTAVAFAAAAFVGTIPLPVIFLLLVLAGAVSPFYMGGLSSFVVGAIPDGRRAFAYDALSYNVSAVAGPAAVAVIAAFLPAQAALGVLAVAAALGAIAVRSVRLRPHGRGGGSPWQAIKSGLHRIFSHRPLAVVTASSTLTQLGQGGLAIAAVALSIERIGSPGEGAALVTSFAIGSLLGALYETARPTRRRPQGVMMAGFLATGVLTVAAAINLGTVWTLVVLGLSGVFTAPTAAAMLFLRNKHSPVHMKSQIFTVSAGFRASASAGGAALAASVAGLGGAVMVVAMGAIWIVSAAVMIGYPKDVEP
ncbi:MFS transporter [Paenarthrobacter sp. NPDC089322]|uniref:MFS transporter n=1 Tax=Paenarthrobacter sp. NPDC089322 TaxID=3155065 RepID=UPI00341BF57D